MTILPTYEEVADALEAADWIYAKTMPQWPHEYTLRRAWTQPLPFEAVVQFIYDNGYRELFEPTGNTFVRLNVGPRKYWPMNAPAAETILINRALRDPRNNFDADPTIDD